MTPEQMARIEHDLRDGIGDAELDLAITALVRSHAMLEVYEQTHLGNLDDLRQQLQQAERERDEAVAALDANWVTHQRVVQAEVARISAIQRAETERLRREDAEATMRQLRAALEFYANGKHYWLNGYHEPRISDLGEHAKAALAETEVTSP